MPDSQLLVVVLIALVAGVILFRLYTVLGRRTGHERPPEEYRLPGQVPAPSPPVKDAPARALPAPAGERPSDPVARGLLDIKLADSGFETGHFLSGARQAYEMIVTGFAAGDRTSLRPLLGDEVWRAFEAAIAKREAAGETVAFTFVGFKDAKIVQATLSGREAEITVAFGAEFISATSDASGKVIEGDTKTVREVTDVWTFARDVRARDPNWTLIATSGDHA